MYRMRNVVSCLIGVEGSIPTCTCLIGVEGSIPTCTCFYPKNFFHDFFFVDMRNFR